MTGRSYPAARSAVLALVDAFNAYERALATTSGDTATEKPLRPVPQRRPRK